MLIGSKIPQPTEDVKNNPQTQKPVNRGGKKSPASSGAKRRISETLNNYCGGGGFIIFCEFSLPKWFGENYVFTQFDLQTHIFQLRRRGKKRYPAFGAKGTPSSSKMPTGRGHVRWQEVVHNSTIWAVTQGPRLVGLCWGWNPTQLYSDIISEAMKSISRH